MGSHAERPSRTLLQAFRATLLLLPLLGLQYLVTPFRPEGKDHPWSRAYEVTSAITASFQVSVDRGVLQSASEGRRAALAFGISGRKRK